MKLQKIIHNKEQRIKLEFPYNAQLIDRLKQMEDARWSQTHRAWHIPYTKHAYIKLKELFPESEQQMPSSLSEANDTSTELYLVQPKPGEIQAIYYGKRIYFSFAKRRGDSISANH